MGTIFFRSPHICDFVQELVKIRSHMRLKAEVTISEDHLDQRLLMDRCRRASEF